MENIDEILMLDSVIVLLKWNNDILTFQWSVDVLYKMFMV